MYLDWQRNGREYLVVDIETDGLDAGEVFCLCWENVRTGERGDCIGHDEVRSFMECTGGDILVAHNGVSFDFPVLQRLRLGRPSPSRCVDTLLLSHLYSPGIFGGHSLRAWGERLGFEKGHFSDFSFFSPEMLTYCRRDVEVTAVLFRRLTKTLQKIGFSEKSIETQHHWWAALQRQKRTGFYFDIGKAEKLYEDLRERERDYERDAVCIFGQNRTEVGRYVRSHRLDGSPTKAFECHSLGYSDIEVDEGGGYRVYQQVDLNPRSPLQRSEVLVRAGWAPQPDELTPTGLPKPFTKGRLAPSLEKFLEDNPSPGPAALANFMVVNGRANMVRNWIENYNEDTHAIHGDLFIADTLRLRHSNPNTANIPSVKLDDEDSPILGLPGGYGYESRDCWAARPGRTLVGTDASGLELRLLACLLGRKEFTHSVVNGDPHSYNAEQMGVERPKAKNGIYAIVYGAQEMKFASTIGVELAEGRKIRNLFLDKLGLREVIDRAKAEQKTGRIRLIDGSLVTCPIPHASLNYKLQGSGARLMATACVILEKELRRKGLDSLKVGDIHDEWQYDVSLSDADEHARLSIEAIRRAGEELNLPVPMDGKAVKGLTWAQTH